MQRRIELELSAGLMVVLVAAVVWFGSGPLPAMAQQAPPRPTLTPLPPQATPTTPPPSSDDQAATPVAAGRITGTVIDTTTGAPVSGLRVQVGDMLVTTDANGNYDRSGLVPGSYVVMLMLSPGQGTTSQGSIAIQLASGETVVQHLFFSSPGSAAPTALPATAAPADPPPQTPVLQRLPATGESQDFRWAWAVSALMLLAMGIWISRRAQRDM